MNEFTTAYFRAHEGCVPHLYLDVVGLPTCGIGFLLTSEDACAALDFVRKDGVAASDEEKRREWQAIKAMEKGHVANFYEPHCALRLPDAAIDAEFARIVGRFEASLRKRWPGFDGFPHSAQLGLLDMAYSLGEGGLFKGYPKFCVAVDAGDWTAAASECVRRGVSITRNADCAALFRTVG